MMIIQDIKNIITTSQETAVRSVDYQRVLMYWQIGKRILEEEQGGQQRAEYGKYLLKNLAEQLEPEFGSGFSVRQLELSRQFYKTFSNTNILYSQLNWSQYKLLIRIEDDYKREFFTTKSVKNNWENMIIIPNSF